MSTYGEISGRVPRPQVEQTCMPQIRILGDEYGFTVMPNLLPEGRWDHAAAANWVFDRIEAEGIVRRFVGYAPCDISALNPERPIAIVTPYGTSAVRTVIEASTASLIATERYLGSLLHNYIIQGC